MLDYPPVLDVCCGSRMFWFDRTDERALYVDVRSEEYPIDIGTPGTIGRSPIVVRPDIQASFSSLPFPDETFQLVVYDPPHMRRNSMKGALTRKYGILRGEWQDMLREGFAECFRVLKPSGVLIFKWCEVEVPLREILALTAEKPLFGHRSGKHAQTHWCTFLKTRESA